MFRRILTICTGALILLLASATGPVQAKYQYGRYAQGKERGYIVFAEVIWANPRNVDAVVATQETIQNFGGGVNMVTPIIPVWDDEVSGRLGLGYQWASGNQLSLTFWNFETEQNAAGNGASGGLLDFAIGPPIRTGTDFVGDNASPGSYAIRTEVKATTVDLAFGREQELAENFDLAWSLGLRYAKYEETSDGRYDEQATTDPGFGQDAYNAAKSNQGEMFGVRAALRGSYRFVRSVSLDGQFGFSFLDGELTASSGLTPAGSINSGTTPAAFSGIVDDGRSGNIWDIDIRVTYHGQTDAFRVWLGWEQQVWDNITADLVRNFPGTTAPLRDRDSVSFSGYKLGVYFRF